MFSLKKRVMLFLLACIPARIILAIIPGYINKKYLRYYGVVLLTISFGFLNGIVCNKGAIISSKKNCQTKLIMVK